MSYDFSQTGVSNALQFSKNGGVLTYNSGSFTFTNNGGLIPVQVGTATIPAHAAPKSYIDAAVTQIDNTITNILAMIHSTNIGAGLGMTTGNYTANGSSYYLTEAISLQDADNKLDTAIHDLAGLGPYFVASDQPTFGDGTDGSTIPNTSDTFYGSDNDNLNALIITGPNGLIIQTQDFNESGQQSGTLYFTGVSSILTVSPTEFWFNPTSGDGSEICFTTGVDGQFNVVLPNTQLYFSGSGLNLIFNNNPQNTLYLGNETVNFNSFTYFSVNSPENETMGVDFNLGYNNNGTAYGGRFAVSEVADVRINYTNSVFIQTTNNPDNDNSIIVLSSGTGNMYLYSLGEIYVEAQNGLTLTGDVAIIGTLTTNNLVVNQTTVSYSSSITLGLNGGNYLVSALTGNLNLTNPSNLVPGAEGRIILVQDVSGGRTISFDTQYLFPGGTAPVLSSGAGAIDELIYYVMSPTQVLIRINSNYSA